MPTAVQILGELGRDELKALVDSAELRVDDRRVKQQLLEALLSRPLRETLERIGYRRLKRLCRDVGLDATARSTVELVERLGQAADRATGAVIESFTIKNFKSVREASLPLSDALTVLIGANASGKSNVLEAIRLLSWLANNGQLSQLEREIDAQLGLRGTSRDLKTRERSSAPVGFRCHLRRPDMADAAIDLSVALQVDDERVRIVGETLDAPAHGSALPLYSVVDAASRFGRELSVEYNNFARGRRKPRITCVDEQAVFTQLTTPARFGAAHPRSQALIPAEARRVKRALGDIMFLDPSPRRMRGYSYIDDRRLRGDGRNISSVLYELTEVDGRKEEVLAFVRALPEQDIQDIRYLEGPRNDVMVALRESFGGALRDCEAALLSDGTLRVLAVAAALLSVSEDTLVVIEEIDNGVHPSRAQLIVDSIREVAARRQLKVLLTTHNPALLDALPDAALPNVVACYRDRRTGETRLSRLEEVDDYPRLIARGTLGRVATNRTLEDHLHGLSTGASRKEHARAWLDALRGPG